MTKMKFTIGTVSNSLNLEEDLRLIKALYYMRMKLN